MHPHTPSLSMEERPLVRPDLPPVGPDPTKLELHMQDTFLNVAQVPVLRRERRSHTEPAKLYWSMAMSVECEDQEPSNNNLLWYGSDQLEMPIPMPSEVTRSPMLPTSSYPQHNTSQGSVLHGNGACRPCAWFWKPGGCKNGEGCGHCHLCPEGEIKMRKKAKVSMLRTGNMGIGHKNTEAQQNNSALGGHPSTHDGSVNEFIALGSASNAPVAENIAVETVAQSNSTERSQDSCSTSFDDISSQGHRAVGEGLEQANSVPVGILRRERRSRTEPCKVLKFEPFPNEEDQSQTAEEEETDRGRRDQRSRTPSTKILSLSYIEPVVPGQSQEDLDGTASPAPKLRGSPQHLAPNAWTSPPYKSQAFASGFSLLNGMPSGSGSEQDSTTCSDSDPGRAATPESEDDYINEAKKRNLCGEGSTPEQLCSQSAVSHVSTATEGNRRVGFPDSRDKEMQTSSLAKHNPAVLAEPAKIASTLLGGRGGLIEEDYSVEETPAPPPGLHPPVGTASHGSILHSIGECEPCAWFWKPGGCQNGAECGRCHLCPEGETKARKKAKVSKMRSNFNTPKPDGPVQAYSQISLKYPESVDEGSEDLPLMPSLPDQVPTGAPRDSFTVKVKNTFIDDFLDEEECQQDLAVASCPANVFRSNRRAMTEPMKLEWTFPETSVAVTPVTLDDTFEEHASAMSPAADLEDPNVQPPLPPPGLRSASNLPSKGSALHGTGQCRPCAWFWKPGSCQNAAECGHCHLCPEGEIKARKKAKVAMLRQGIDGQKVRATAHEICLAAHLE